MQEKNKVYNNGWQIKSLGEVAEFLDSQRIPVKEEERAKRVGPYPYYGANGQVGWIDNYIFDEPLVLLAEDGGNFGSIDKPIAYKITGKSWVNNHAHVLRAKPNCNIDYLHRVLSFYDLSKVLTGTTRQKLRKGDAEKIKIQIPPLPIQKQIAEILEQADRAKQKRKEANKLTDEFLQSVFIEMFGDPVNNPKGWDKIELGEVISILMDYHSNGSYETLRNNVKLLDTPDYSYMVRTTDLEKQDYETDVKYVSKSSYDFLKKSKIFGGEIIINKIGSAGQVYLMPYLNRKVSLGMNQFGLRFNDNANNIYIYFLLKSSYGESIIKKKVQGAVTKTITKEAVRSLIIPLPSLSLQQQFAEIVNKTEALKEKQKQSEHELKNLFQSLMQTAFKGELV